MAKRGVFGGEIVGLQKVGTPRRGVRDVSRPCGAQRRKSCLGCIGGRRCFILDYSSTWMKVLLFAAEQHDAEIIMNKSVFIHVDPRRDDSNPSALFCGVRSMSIQLHPACLASGPDLSRELSRLIAVIEHFHQFCSRFVYCIGLGRRQAAST